MKRIILVALALALVFCLAVTLASCGGTTPTETTKDNGGIAVMTQKKGQRILEVTPYEKGTLESEHRYRTRNLPAAGSKQLVGTASQEKLEL